MIEILPESTETCIGFLINGKVTAEDYEILIPKLDEAIATSGKINLLAVMGDFEGIKGFNTVKADYKFGTQQYRQVERATYVGEKKWMEWMIKIMDPFTRRTDEKFFKPYQLEEAWQWVLTE